MIRDLTRQRFGRLIAVRPTAERRNGSVVWECLCDCGNTVLRTSAGLRTGKTKSCGCLKKEVAATTGKKRCIECEKELIGKRFGRLTVIGRSGNRNASGVLWECKCDCGNTAFYAGNKLKSGMAKSCGCLRREYLLGYGKGRLVDLSGKRFGKLVVLAPMEERQNRRVVWECKCDCGNTTVVLGASLTQGDTKSCGCLRKKKTDERGDD